MIAYMFTIEAVRERFMEPPRNLKEDTFVIADSYDEAHSFVWGRLNQAGWKVKKISGKEIFLQDIRGHDPNMP